MAKGVKKPVVDVKVEPEKITKSLSIDIGVLRKRKVCIATPMYGGQCTGPYTYSLLQFAELTKKYQLEYQAIFHYNESLIQRARNYLVDTFLRSDCTHLMFIDADIGFGAMDLLALLALSDPDSDKKVLCGLYPKKQIVWENVSKAVEKKVVEKPDDLAQFAGAMAFNLIPNTNEFSLLEPVEIMEGATGFMMIQRSVFEDFKAAYPEQTYLPDHKNSEHFDGSRDISAYFDCKIDPESKRYLSEDYNFCHMVRDIGVKVWACPWMNLVHIGSYGFQGSLSALSAIDGPPN
jgi:hypothetical protein